MLSEICNIEFRYSDHTWQTRLGVTNLRVFFVLIMSIAPLISSANDQSAIQYLSARGGQLSLTFYRGNLRDIGMELEGADRQDFQYDTKTLMILSNGGINFRANDGYFTQLEDGHLSLETGLAITANGLRRDSSQLRITPKALTRDTLLLSDEQGLNWFYLDYGHYERLGQWLYARYLDMRISQELADRLGDPTLHGHLVGYATLETKIDTNPEVQLSGADACPVESPNWPTQEGYDADIAMLKLSTVSQIARQDGKVAIAPSAYFENIGNADVPWFAQFADSRNADACCVDHGDGLCAPYGNDQGGLLVYALYRFVDGRLEQLGQSQVKHAFNSVNMDTVDGSLPCRAADRGGRIVPSGCEDLYQAGTNSAQAFLGPRDEIIAHRGVWLRAGSIWDQTGPAGIPDGNCDYMPANPVHGGQVPCQAPAADAMARRLAVSEADLTTQGARYFIEAWYLVRDDINLFNSFGRKEIKPVFTTTWSFPEVAPFQQGPVIEEYPALQGENTAGLVDDILVDDILVDDILVDDILVDDILSDEGQLRVSSSVRRLGSARWQYDIGLMNLDFDRAIDGFDIPVPDGVSLTMAEFFDGDSDPDNNWLITTPPGSIRFQAPENVSLKWGSLVSFRFEADRAPEEVTASLTVAGAGMPDHLEATTFSAVAILFEDGFE